MRPSRNLSRSVAVTMLTGLLVLGSASGAMAVSPPPVINEYPLPGGGSGAYGLTTGPDGNLWVTDHNRNTIVKMAPSGAILASYPIPTASSGPHGITAGRDGNLWFVEEDGQKIARITTAGGITEYPLSTPQSRPQDITVGPDCNLWFTDAFGSPASSRVGYITPAGVITEFQLPSTRYPWGIHAGPDGNIWFAEYNGTNVGQISPSGVITEIPIDPTAGTGGGQSVGITWGPDDKIWFTLTNSNVIGRMATDGTGIVYFPQPLNSAPQGITDGPDGHLWFVDQWSSRVGQADTAGNIVTNPTPTAGSGPEEITTGPDGAVWFTEYSVNKVGRVPMPGTTAPGRPGNVTAVPATGGVKVSWTVPTFNGGSPITTYSITPYIGNVAQTATTVPAPATSAVITGLVNDTSYSFRVAAANTAIGPGPKVASCGTVTPEPSLSVLPALSNGAYGGYKTVVYVENTGSAATHVSINYSDASGNAVGSGDVNNNLAPHALWVVPQDNNHSFSAGQAGSGVISSGQPISAFVNEFAPGAGDATSYSAAGLATGVGPTLYVPTIVNGAYGGYTTGVGLLNLASSAADLTITYRDAGGSVIKTQLLPAVPAGAYQSVYSGDATLALPSAFAGTATIASSAGNLAAVVNEVGPGGQFSSFAAVPSGNLRAFAPAALNAAYGGYFTGMAIQNTTATSGTVIVTYYDGAGTPSSRNLPISANGYVGIYQGDPVNGTPAAGPYTATITSNVAVAVTVNEVAPASGTSRQSTSYNGFAAGKATSNLPLVESAGADGWSTGEGIMNTGSTAATVTITYYDTSTGAQIGTPAQQTLQPNAFWGAYQPNAGLPSGQRATAAVTTSAGGQVAIICNESSASSFMSYAGQ